MATRNDWIRVELDADEEREANRIARARRGEARSGGYQRAIQGTIREDLRGARGELAVAKWRGVRHPGWGGDVSWRADISRGCDVAGLQVRTAQRPGDGLALDAPPRQPNAGKFVLALDHDAPIIWLVGWIDASDGYRVGKLRHDGVGQADWLRVGQGHLHPMAAVDRDITEDHSSAWLVDPQTRFWCEVCDASHPIIEHRLCRKAA